MKSTGNPSGTTRIVFTPGEPAGIGPDLAVLLAQQQRSEEIMAIACPQTLAARASELKLPLQLELVNSAGEQLSKAAGKLSLWPVATEALSTAGKLSAANAGYVLNTLKQALQFCRENQFQALVTGPVHKGHLMRAGYNFRGHTEYLAELCGHPAPVMLLCAGELRVALLTTHLPLQQVPQALNAARLEYTLKILNAALKKDFGISQPHILVCGLNPHAGEGGQLGNEEQEIIIPCLEQLRQQGYHLSGPLAADTLFVPERLADADAVLAMYHDQGLPVLKYVGFGNAVNITLGLPIIRTSVDHGTALDRAGTGNCDPGSLFKAVATAAEMARNRS